MEANLDKFIARLNESGLLSADEVRTFCDQLPAEKKPVDAEQLARALVKEKKLTAFQANLVYQGRIKNLVIGNYLVLDKIGEGGMGQVFKAQHRRMNRIVALKILPPAMVKSPAAVERFQREVQAAARLDHQNIVTAYDADEANGMHFLVMQFVDGDDLSSITRQRGKLPIADALNYTLQAARGLAYAHAHGIVHRDIKPANLLVDRDGVVKILDMGLARIDGQASGEHEGLTQAGQVMGTLDYMAPEQVTNTHAADARADIYSLGCSMYRMLTGENVYHSDTTIGKVMAHREQPIPSLHAVRPEVSEALDRIFQRMVAKRPEDRYQTMNEVVTDLERLQSGSMLAAPVSLPISPQPTAVWQPPTTTVAAPGATMVMPSATSGNSSSGGSGGYILKVAGTVFATIVAPLLVAVAAKYTDAIFPGPAAPPAAPANPPAVDTAQVAKSPSPAATKSGPTTPAIASSATGNTSKPANNPPATNKSTSTGTSSTTVASAKPVIPDPPVKPAPPPPPKVVLPPQPVDDGPPVRLYNGKNFDGFYTFLGKGEEKAPYGKNNDPEKVFTSRRMGNIHISGKVRGSLMTEKMYRNYRLSLEYRWGEESFGQRENGARDAGVLVHCNGPDDVIFGSFPSSLKIELHEGHTGDFVVMSGSDHKMSIESEGVNTAFRGPGGKNFPRFQFKPGEPVSMFTSGFIWGLNHDHNAKDEKGFRGEKELEKPTGEWNKLEVICFGDYVDVKLNGTLVNHARKVTPSRGRIALQSTFSEWMARNLTLQPLKGP